MRRLALFVLAALALAACADIFGLDPLKVTADAAAEDAGAPDATGQ